MPPSYRKRKALLRRRLTTEEIDAEMENYFAECSKTSEVQSAQKRSLSTTAAEEASFSTPAKIQKSEATSPSTNAAAISNIAKIARVPTLAPAPALVPATQPLPDNHTTNTPTGNPETESSQKDKTEDDARAYCEVIDMSDLIVKKLWARGRARKNSTPKTESQWLLNSVEKNLMTKMAARLNQLASEL